MYVLDYAYVVGFGPHEYNIFIKLLQNDELTENEEIKADQMLETALRMRKVNTTRKQQYQNTQQRVDCSRRDFTDADTETRFQVR